MASAKGKCFLLSIRSFMVIYLSSVVGRLSAKDSVSLRGDGSAGKPPVSDTEKGHASCRHILMCFGLAKLLEAFRLLF
jgi:hypothetical protein